MNDVNRFLLSDENHLKYEHVFGSHELSSDKRKTRDLLRQLHELNDEFTPYVWARYGSSDSLIFYVSADSRTEAFEMRESLQNFLGSHASFPVIEIVPVDMARDKHERSAFDIGCDCLLRVSAYTKEHCDSWGLNQPGSEFESTRRWLIKQLYEFKQLRVQKPVITKTTRLGLPLLLTEFFNCLELADRGGLQKVLESIELTRELDRVNFHSLELLKFDALGEWNNIANHPHLRELLGASFTPAILKIFLRTIHAIYLQGIEEIEWFDQNDPITISNLLKNWTSVFVRQISSEVSLETSEVMVWNLGQVLALEKTVVTGLDDLGPWGERFRIWAGLSVVEPSGPVTGDPEEVPEVFEVAPGDLNSWLLNINEDVSTSLSALMSYGGIWQANDQTIQILDSAMRGLNDIDTSRVLRAALPSVLTIGLDDRQLYTAEEIVSLAEALAITSDHVIDRSDLLVAYMMVTLLVKRPLSRDCFSSFISALDVLINSNLSINSLDATVDLLEILYEAFPNEAGNFLRNVWLSKVLPLAKRHIARLSGDSLLVIDDLSEMLVGEDAEKLVTVELIDDQSDHSSINITIGIYSLDEGSIERVCKYVRLSFPNVSIRTNSDKVATPALRNMVRDSDVVFFASGKAKHAAFFCVKDELKGKPLRYPEGNGSSSLLREISSYLRKSLSLAA